MLEAEQYDTWYETARGRWIGQEEFSSVMKLITPTAGQTLLEIGSGTGYFSHKFKQRGLRVIGIDPDKAMNDYASTKHKDIKFIRGDGLNLPFADNSFDYCAAITSLCFISDPEKALAEMWRVSRQSVVLGLLNRHSLLYYMKRNSKGYQGARWDTIKSVKEWANQLIPTATFTFYSAIWLPNGGVVSRRVENIMPAQYPYAGFLAVALEKQ